MFTYRPASQCFEISDTIRAAHHLYEDFTQERKDINKFTFYLWLNQNQLNAKRGKDENGNFGYGLKYVEKQQ